MAWSKPKKKKKNSIEKGKPRDEAERQKVNKTLETDYGIKEAFKKGDYDTGFSAPQPAVLRGTNRIRKGMGDSASGIKTDAEKAEEARKRGK